MFEDISKSEFSISKFKTKKMAHWNEKKKEKKKVTKSTNWDLKLDVPGVDDEDEKG